MVQHQLSGQKRPRQFQEPPNGFTKRYFEALERLGTDLSLPHNVAELQLMLSNISMPQLLISAEVYEELSGGGHLPTNVDWVAPAADETDYAAHISNDIATLIATLLVVCDSEDTMHALLDTVLGIVCVRGFGGYKRNKADSHSVGRADFSCPVDVHAIPIVVFRGEDKMEREANGRHHPRTELEDKTPWEEWPMFFNDLPYIFGYFAVGRPGRLQLQLGCLVQEQRKFVALGQTHDLATVAGRVQAYLFFLKLVPFLRAAANRASGAPLNLDWELDRGDGVTLRYAVMDGVTRVRKRYKCPSTAHAYGLHDAWLARKRFLASIEGSQNFFVPVLEIYTDDKDAIVHFARCDEVEMTLANVLMAVYHTMEALEVLHANGCVHNDIRWPNVMFSRAASRYVLIDFDMSAMLEEDNLVPPIYNLSREDHAPSIRERHGPEVDVWGVGNMMRKQNRIAWLVQLGFRVVDPGVRVPTVQELKREFLDLVANRLEGVEFPFLATNARE